MTADGTPGDSPRAALALRGRTLMPFAVLLGIVAVLAFWLGVRWSAGPREGSPEAGFARDMMMLHAQAVDMATLLRDRTHDPEMRQLALDIMLTQQAQIGQIQGWLAAWDLPPAGRVPAMAWIDMPTTERMPGMATPDEINQLRASTEVEADGLFMTLMIPHHRGGVAMASTILERTRRPEVRALAGSIVAAQTCEIALMQELLQRKGLPLVPEDQDMSYGPDRSAYPIRPQAMNIWMQPYPVEEVAE